MDSYYVRSRGKVVGPFGMEALQELVRRGRLSRFDQVSTDSKATWKTATAVPDLFAVAAPRPGAGVATVEGGRDDHAPLDDDGRGQRDGSPPHGRAPRAAFFYAQNGAAVGPVSLHVLQTLASNGTLRRDDPVWAEGSDVATPARQVPMLASVYSGRPRGVGGATLGDEGGQDDASLPASVRSTQYYAKVVYFVAAGLTLVFSVLPIAIINGRAQWWWNADGATAAGSIYSILAAIALLIVTPLVAGAARPIVALSLVAAPMVLGFADSLVRTSEFGGTAMLGAIAVWGAIVLPVLLATINRVRPRLVDGGPQAARVLQIVLGALTLLSALAGIVLLVVAADNWIARPRGALVAAYACTWLGVLANLAAGLLAIVAGKPRFERGLNLASTICLGAAGGAFVLAAGVLVAEASEAARLFDAGVVAYVAFRVAVLFVAAVAWLSASFRELLAWSFRYAAAD